MLRRTSILACLAVCTAAQAITPADIPLSAGPINTSDRHNAEFLNAVTHTNLEYYTNPAAHGTGDKAGANFHAADTLPSTIPGYGSNVAVRVWFLSESADFTN